MIDDNEDNVIRMLNLVIQRLAGMLLPGLLFTLTTPLGSHSIGVVDFIFFMADNSIVIISDYSDVHGPTESDGRFTDIRKDEREEAI